MTFFEICPHDEMYLNNNIGAIPLRVNQDNGVNVTPNVDITVTDLNTVNNMLYHHFFNHGDGGITAKVRVLISKDDYINNVKNVAMVNSEDYKVISVLGYIYSHMIPVMVRTDAIDMPNGLYLIVKNPSRNQNYNQYTEWELELMTYTPLNIEKWKNNNANVLNAIKKAKSKRASTHNSKLRKCNYKTLVYSKNKKIVPCVKHMQQILYKQKILTKKQVDGWYGKETVKAVKIFQQRWNKKHGIKTIKKGYNKNAVVIKGKSITNTKNKNIKLPRKVKLSKTGKNKGATVAKLKTVLNVNGKVDKATWKALCDS